jgi:major intracellular serine protease
LQKIVMECVMKKKYECKLFPYKREDCLSLQDAKQKSGWNITAFDLPKAWELSQGEGIVIAVLDTGCDLDHPDLINNLLPGYNFVNPGSPPVDDNGHGSHVIGTLVAENNDIGVVGVCPKTKVRPVKVLDGKGNGNLLNVAKGIRWAIEQKVDLISMSLGAPSPVAQVRKAIQAAAAAGITCFVAAGNAGNTKDVFYPSAYPETIAIGAIDINMRRASFSNTGMNLDFMAPGVDIFSTVPDNWYATLSGTSMAQPFACGVAALVLSYVRAKRPDIVLKSSKDYIELFKKYTIPTGDVYDNPHFYQGFGIIDPRKFTGI